ncbi:bcl-2-interacting killer isoform X1 [Ailuropoda melanoleuca]|uniref:BCL2 interacting killer n=3 Tax=Ailuropoda melanoleuca TaxID=9646 RepID=A0A7N5KDU2_AILME|nr:bcl-2-interacting killer isoform X1 [Ailuropoda melanoleuca]
MGMEKSTVASGLLGGRMGQSCQDPGSYTQIQPLDSSTSTPWRLLNAPPCWETALADGGAQTAHTFTQPPRTRGRGSGAAGRERRPRGRAGAGPAVYKLARRPEAADNTAPGSSAPAATIAATAAATSDAREEMSHTGPLSRNLFLSTFLQEHGPEVLEVPGMTDLVEYYDPGPSPNSNNPDDVAMRLAFIGDEMEVRWMLPRVGELPGMAMYSLAFTYNQTGLRGVLRSLVDGLTNLRENVRIWSFLTFRNRVSPHPGRGLVLSLLLLLGLLLGWGFRLLQ